MYFQIASTDIYNGFTQNLKSTLEFEVRGYHVSIYLTTATLQNDIKAHFLF